MMDAGHKKSLDEKDVWQMSPFMQTKIIMDKFGQLTRKSLLFRLLQANSLDIFLDTSLTAIVSVLDYSSVALPVLLEYLLKRWSTGTHSSSS